MLHAFKDQIKSLAVHPQDPFRTYLRKRMGKKATEILEKKVKRFILMTPDIVTRTYGLWAKSRSPNQIKKLGGYLLTYLYHGKDFLPEESQGLFGYLDDAYVAATVFENAMNEMHTIGLKTNQKDEQLLKEVATLRRIVARVIPIEAAKIHQMVEEIKNNREDTFAMLFL